MLRGRRPRRVIAAAAITALVTVGAPAPGWGQATRDLESLEQEVDALKERQEAILRELQEIRRILGRRADAVAIRDVVLNLEGAIVLGKDDARITVFEFSDYQCPFCARYARDTFPRIERDYIDTGIVRYVIRDFPLVSVHPQAFKGHEAVRCAGDQGKAWDLHGRLFANQQAMTPSDLVEHARALGLDVAAFRECLDGGKHAAEIRQLIAEGRLNGVRGTPTFLFGLTVPGVPKVKILGSLTGAQPFEKFKEQIDTLLKLPPAKAY